MVNFKQLIRSTFLSPTAVCCGNLLPYPSSYPLHSSFAKLTGTYSRRIPCACNGTLPKLHTLAFIRPLRNPTSPPSSSHAVSFLTTCVATPWRPCDAQLWGQSPTVVLMRVRLSLPCDPLNKPEPAVMVLKNVVLAVEPLPQPLSLHHLSRYAVRQDLL